MSKVKYGFKAKLYLNPGAYATPTWKELPNVSDCSLAVEFAKTDANIRGANGIKTEEPVLLGLSVGGKIISDETDTTGYVAIEDATLTRAALDLLILDGPIDTDGSRGFRVDVKNGKWTEDQGPGNILYREFDFSPCIPVNGVPSRAVITSGSPVFTPL